MQGVGGVGGGLRQVGGVGGVGRDGLDGPRQPVVHGLEALRVVAVQVGQGAGLVHVAVAVGHVAPHLRAHGPVVRVVVVQVPHAAHGGVDGIVCHGLSAPATLHTLHTALLHHRASSVSNPGS